MTLFKNALIILLVGIGSSAIPFGPHGVLLGLPSVLIATTITLLLFKERLK